MNVHPGLTTHPKFVAFKRDLGAPDALEYVLRLWGHCQERQRGEDWGAVDAGYVEAICQWHGESGRLWAALARPFCGRPGWIRLTKKKHVIVTNWDEHNQRLVTNWKMGPSGGRPKVNPTPTQTESKPNPTHNPRVIHTVNPSRTQAEPHGKPIGVDRIAEEGSTDPEARARTGPDFPEAEIPSLAEVLAECGLRGIPEQTGRDFFAHYATVASPAWTDGGNRRFQWRGKLRSWHVKNMADGPRKNGAAPADVDEKARLEALRDAETDPEKRAELKRKIKAMA